MQFFKWILILLLSISLPALAFTYPETMRGNQVDVYHGQKIADPYRWLEKTNDKSVEDWLEKQKKLTVKYLDATPMRNAIRRRGNKLIKFDHYNLLDSVNGKILFSIETPEEAYRSPIAPKTCCLLDVNAPKTAVAILQDIPATLKPKTEFSAVTLSPDTQKAVYSVSISGFEYPESPTHNILISKTKWRSSVIQKIKNLSTNQEYKEAFSNIHPIGWKPDSSGFYYTKFKTNDSISGHNLFFHMLGTSPDKDKTIFADKALNSFHGQCFVKNGYLFYTTYSGNKSALYCGKLDGSSASAQLLPWSTVPILGGKKWFIGMNNDQMIIVSDTKSGKSKIVSMKLSPSLFKSRSARHAERELIPESRDVLEAATMVGDRIFALYLHEAYNHLFEFDCNGKQIREITLPGIGRVTQFRAEERTKSLVYQFESFTQPPSIFRQGIDEDTAHPILVPELIFNSKHLLTRLVHVPTPDGAEVPMLLFYDSRIEINSNTPALLEGYGGYGVTMSPTFQTESLIWTEMGGVYARACIRGGGEYGEAWHQAAVGTKKETSIRDFISCAEWLCKNKITSPAKLAITGCSNGGLLTGATMLARPDLFGGVCIDSGMLDMLRYDKLNPNLCTTEFGTVVDKKQFQSLRSLSPLQRIRSGKTYPATLITVKDLDDVVSPAHSYKFTAALQHAQKGDNPILIDSIKTRDHGLSAEKDFMDKYGGLERIIFLSRALKFEADAKKRLDWLNDSFSN